MIVLFHNLRGKLELVNIFSSEATTGVEECLHLPHVTQWMPAAHRTLVRLAFSCSPGAQPMLMTSNMEERNSTSTLEGFVQLVQLGSKLEVGLGNSISSSFPKAS